VHIAGMLCTLQEHSGEASCVGGQPEQPQDLYTVTICFSVLNSHRTCILIVASRLLRSLIEVGRLRRLLVERRRLCHLLTKLSRL